MLRQCEALTPSLLKGAKPGVLPRAVTVLMAVAAFAAAAQPAYGAPPANDTPSGATPINALPFDDTVTIDEATTDALDATLRTQCGGLVPATEGSVWYRFVAPKDAIVLLDVSRSSFNASALVTAGDPANGTLVTCGPGVFVSFAVGAGQTFYIMAFSDTPGVTTGTLVFRLVEPPPAILIDVTVNPIGTFDRKSGSATISGTLKCTQTATFMSSVQVDVSQRVGDLTLHGSTIIHVMCTAGTPQRWQAEVSSPTGKFSRGNAVAIAHAFACDDFTCAEDSEERTVKLRRKHARWPRPPWPRPPWPR